MNFQSLPLPPPRLATHPQDVDVFLSTPCTRHPLKGAHKENSTLLELHTHILLDPGDEQLAYYSPGSGRGPLGNVLEALSGRRSKKTIVDAYRWLCERYLPGDRIFLFGFSKGAYNVQTLASMIDMVGLVNVGNQRAVSNAYDVFCRGDGRAATKFRSTFARKAKVHFIGVWETSIAARIFGTRPGPSESLPERVCIFRQALALDELRAGCVPVIPATTDEPATDLGDIKLKSETGSVETIGSETGTSTARARSRSRSPRPMSRRASSLASRSSRASRVGRSFTDVKEVWFAGTQAELGAGLQLDGANNLSSVPLSWMENEAATAGLRLRSRLRTSKSKWDTLHSGKHSLGFLRRISELRPERPSKSRRKIEAGQQVHAAVAFEPGGYRPRVSFANIDAPIDWKQLVGQNTKQLSFDWAFAFGHRLEASLFDAAAILEAIRGLADVWKQPNRPVDLEREAFWIERLSFMALTGKLCETYLANDAPIWNDDRHAEYTAAVTFFGRLMEKQPAIFTGDLAEILEAQCRFIHRERQEECNLDLEKQLEEALRLRRIDVSLPINQPLRAYKLAACLVSIGAYSAIAFHKLQKALFFLDESVDVLRPLLETDFPLSYPHFALLQRTLSTCLQNLGYDSSALRVSEAVVALSRDLTETHPQCGHVLAGALHDLAFGFNSKLRLVHEDDPAEECVRLYRSLADEDPAGYDDLLALALHNYSLDLLRRAQYDKAHSLFLEELDIRRKLDDADALSGCLEQLARCLSALGKVSAAIDAADEAVSLRQRTLGSTIDETKLADALHLQSCCLSLSPGRTEDALVSARQAVSTQRGLAKDPLFNIRLGIFLTNFSVALSEAGKHVDALRAAQEVVTLRAEGWGDDADCALSLSRMAVCLRNTGKYADSLVVAEKCLELVQSIVISSSTEKWELHRIEMQLAETLHALSICLVDGPGGASDAVHVAADSAARYRRLVAKGNTSMALETAFVRSLVQWSRLLVLSDQQDAALRIAVEAAQIAGGSVPREVYAQSVLHLSTCLYAVGKEQQAGAPAQKAVDTLRVLTAEHPDSWRLKEQLADALFNASLYPAHPPSFNALAAIREAVGLQKQLGDRIEKDRSEPRLADGLQNLAARALLAGVYDEALDASQQALQLARDLALRNPATFTASLINILYTHANVLCELERYAEAYDLVVECDNIGQDMQSESLFTTLEAGAAYMSTRARCLLGLARREEGVRGLIEGLRLYRAALESPLRRSMFESFPWFLNNAFACISMLGRTNSDALSATTDLVELARLMTENCAGQVDHYLRLVLEYHVGSLSGQS
ncbi:DUF2235 domain-containing protein [Mycena chlorophos]|uniref:DUF2235 domain-containing protein n=1 Tax=Mycena chlorophos TaxID=658473 RepID=A0A8H6THG8_MYCCL|nr:DUF2235 domain-containing protein [Mycena chlorophos]